MHQVVIAGAGPTGLMLAAELALARIDVAIVERRESQALAGSRAGGLVRETMDQLWKMDEPRKRRGGRSQCRGDSTRWIRRMGRPGDGRGLRDALLTWFGPPLSP